MRRYFPGQTVIRLVAALGVLQAGLVSAASAAVISAVPMLPLLGVPYTATVGVGCFPAAGICVEPGALVRTAPVSSSFGPAGQDIITAATYTGVLTDLSHAPIASIVLNGTVHELVNGRMTPTETGSWSTTLVGLSLSGTVAGSPFTLALSATQPSTGTTSITPIVGTHDDVRYLIDSAFDIFLDLTMPPLRATRGPIHVTASEVPEPASAALLVTAVLGLAGAAARRRVAPAV